MIGREPAGVGRVLDGVLEIDPDRVAVVARERTLTYRELDEAADAAAAVLADWGVRAGDRVAACLPNGCDIVVAFHAAMRLGAIWVGVNQSLVGPERAALLADARPRVLLWDRAGGAALGAAAGPGSPRVIESSPNDPQAEWTALVAAARGAARPPDPDQHAAAAIAYTSGTTGRPRGVVHSQHNLLLPGAAIVASRRYDSSLVKGDFLPLTILNMLALTTVLTAQAGGRCVLIDRRDARGMADWIEQETIGVWNGVPALLYSMVADDELEPRQLSSLVEVWTGGGDCPEHLREAFMQRFGVAVVATYGLTEAPTVVTMDALDGEHVQGSSGTPLPHLELAIVDDAGEPVSPGEVGEIVVKAAEAGPWGGRYTPMLRYWDEPPTVTSGPALRTGDLGCLDDTGRLFVRDRKKLVIIRGGANVYPAEVERVLSEADGVQACAVFGIPDERLGQRVMALVEVAAGSAATPETMLAHCRANLGKYKVPELIVGIDMLPRNAMGKVQRAALVGLLERQTQAGCE